MATYYGINAGGNWSAGATWSTISTKDVTRVGGSTAPTNADDCILDDYSGAVTIDATSCVSKSLNCTINGNYAGTLTFTATKSLTVSGSVTVASTMTLAGTGRLTINATSTLTSAGLTFPGDITFSSSTTTTLVGNLVITGTLTFPAGCIMAGAYDITCTTFVQTSTSGQTAALVAGQTLTISSIWQGCTTGFAAVNLKSATASAATYITYQGTAANCKVAGGVFTDIDASGSAQAIDNWFGGTLTRCTNIVNRTSADFATAAQAAKILDDTTISGITGTIATRTLSAANETVAAGYYAATTLSAVDVDLDAANIVAGKTIFGFVGSASGGGGSGGGRLVGPSVLIG